MAMLYIVGTPIGNLGDITLRALETLKSVDVILCEDTRVTKKLLNAYDIQKPTLSYHSHSGLAKVDKIFELLRNDKNLALVSDAGTPTISDPGTLLVSAVRKELPDVSIVPIPGPSAVITALSASGFYAAEFLFLGFLPHKKGRETLFKEIADEKRTVVFYESSHRILKTLESLQKHIPQKRITVARELTKIHEEIVKGFPEEVKAHFNENPEKVRGEFVVLVARPHAV
jgi:16S rRNA (cytidine1402-2'-O)-methyltransferase